MPTSPAVTDFTDVKSLMFVFDKSTRYPAAHALLNSIHGGEIPDLDRLCVDATTKVELNDDCPLIDATPFGTN